MSLSVSHMYYSFSYCQNALMVCNCCLSFPLRSHISPRWEWSTPSATEPPSSPSLLPWWSWSSSGPSAFFYFSAGLGELYCKCSLIIAATHSDSPENSHSFLSFDVKSFIWFFCLPFKCVGFSDLCAKSKLNQRSSRLQQRATVNCI